MEEFSESNNISLWYFWRVAFMRKKYQNSPQTIVDFTEISLGSLQSVAGDQEVLFKPQSRIIGELW